MTVAAFTDRDQSDSSPLGALQPFIEDPTIEEIWINSPARIFIARNGKSELTNLILTKEEVADIIERCLMWGRTPTGFITSICRCSTSDGSRLM